MPSNEEQPRLMSLSEAAEWFLSNEGNAPSVGTIRRWVASGTRGIRLRGVRRGGQWRTCLAWIEEFNRRLNGPSAELESNTAGAIATGITRRNRSAIRRRLIEEGLIHEETQRSVQNLFANRSKARLVQPVLPGGAAGEAQRQGDAGATSGVGLGRKGRRHASK